ncbi:hypothetical protein GCM10010313_78280 [Streptomyces violarus]|nr:hypothetical protein GCM10010313_78280 [Streptomyces violarus]
MKAARLTVLTESEAASPLADVPYSLRHAGVSLWLESGVSPAEVARRAGHSIAVLFRFYAKPFTATKRGPTSRSNRLSKRSTSTTTSRQAAGGGGCLVLAWVPPRGSGPCRSPVPRRCVSLPGCARWTSDTGRA